MVVKEIIEQEIEWPKVIIIVLNWNGYNDTIDCINSIKKSDYPNYEIVIVDNGSNDNSPAIFKERIPNIKLIENEKNFGYTGGNNIGIKYAIKNGAKYVWLLNNDTTVFSNTLSELIIYSISNKRIGLLSPIIYNENSPNKIQYYSSYIDIKNKKIFFASIINEAKDWQKNMSDKIVLWGTALLIKRELIVKIGFLDDRFFAYYEDTDYSLRAINARYENAVVTSAFIKHTTGLNESGEIRGSTHYFYYIIRNNYLFWMKHLPTFERIFYHRKFLLKVLRLAARCKEQCAVDAQKACYDGAWSAIKGISGKWDQSVSMPSFLIKIFSWHPYLLIFFLEGKLTEILKKVIFCFRRKIQKLENVDN